MVLICCKNCIYMDFNYFDLDKPMYICLKKKDREITNRFINFCIDFKKGDDK